MTTTSTSKLSKYLLIFGLSVLLCAEGYFGYQLHTLSKRQEVLKSDYSDFNNIVYGLFSVDQWRDAVAGIINHQVKHFTMIKAQKKDLQIEVQQIIMALINKAEALLDKKPKTLGGKIKKLAVKTFVNTDRIKAQVPGFTKTIIAKIYNPANKSKLSTMALNKFNQAQLTSFMRPIYLIS